MCVCVCVCVCVYAHCEHMRTQVKAKYEEWFGRSMVSNNPRAS